MRVVEDGDAVRRNVDYLIDRVDKCRDRLMRKPVDQIEIDALESKFARPIDDLPRDLLGLHTIDRLLHPRVKVLHAKARAIESDLRKRRDMIATHIPRIDLDTLLDIICEFEPL